MWSVNEVTRKKQAMLCEITMMKKFDIRKNMGQIAYVQVSNGNRSGSSLYHIPRQ